MVVTMRSTLATRRARDRRELLGGNCLRAFPGMRLSAHHGTTPSTLHGLRVLPGMRLGARHGMTLSTLHGGRAMSLLHQGGRIVGGLTAEIWLCFTLVRLLLFFS